MGPEDEQQLNREVTDIELQAESLVILSDDDYASAGEFGRLLKQKLVISQSFAVLTPATFGLETAGTV